MAKTGEQDQGATTMIDLSDLQIPDVSVVPEPTYDLIQAIMSLANTAARDQQYDCLTMVMIYFARRCRNLEAEVERLKAKKCPHDLAREFSKETTDALPA